jgi:hypothetical protein
MFRAYRWARNLDNFGHLGEHSKLEKFMGENPAEKAVEALDKAIEAGEKSGGTGSWARIQQLTTFFASIAALLTAVGAFIKSCDHSVTENAYSTLSKGVQQVQSATDQNHKDLVALRDYVASPSADAGEAPMADTSALIELFDAGPIAFVPMTPASSFASARDQFLNAQPRKDAGAPAVVVVKPVAAAPPPPVHPAPSAWVAKSWPQVENGI